MGISTNGAEKNTKPLTTEKQRVFELPSPLTDKQLINNLRAQQRLDKLAGKITKYFEEKKPWLDAGLKKAQVVADLGANATYIWKALKSKYHCGYCEYVNSFRVEEFIRLHGADNHITKEALAEKAGFSSYNTLLRAFYKCKGMNPNAYFLDSKCKCF